ncbi:methyltransferase domain-containing protein [Pseudomonas sp. 5P_5.1_Bac1]|jgi:SAM-dependent methyltransferase|nr:methyltransferase domain-containing protein [Pseudomonas sp. 5P_5.1_Bac1]
MSAPSFFRPSTESQESPVLCAAQRTDDVVGLLALKTGERLLDIGCGNGYLSAQLANQGAEVVGFDINPERVLAARAWGLEVKRGNAEELYFHQEFDAVFSHNALHEMHQADQVASGAFMALKPGGRFVGEFPGRGHALLIRRALSGALERRSINLMGMERWYLPSAHEYQRVLERAGFHVSHISWFEQPMSAELSIGDWIRNNCGHYLQAVPMEMRIPFLEEVTEELVSDLLDGSGRWTVDATRLRFKAHRKA